ncbi:hypothetical protein ACFL2G_00315 [Candidatus Omnitrophota bacterium]
MKGFRKIYNFNIKMISLVITIVPMFIATVYSCPSSNDSLRVPFLFQKIQNKDGIQGSYGLIINNKSLYALIAPTAITHLLSADNDNNAPIATLLPKVACDLIIKSKSQFFIFLLGDIEQLRSSIALKDAEEWLRNSNFEENSGFCNLGKESNIAMLPRAMQIEHVRLVDEELKQLGQTREFIIVGNTSKVQTQDEAIIMVGLWAKFSKIPYIKLEIRGPDLMTKNVEIVATVKRLVSLNKDIRILPLIGKGITREMLETLLDFDQVVALRIEGTRPGSGKGLGTKAEKGLIRKVMTLARGIKPDIPLIAECGIGTAAQARGAMQMGFNSVLVNAAITQSENPVDTAIDFANAVGVNTVLSLKRLVVAVNENLTYI